MSACAAGNGELPVTGAFDLRDTRGWMKNCPSLVNVVTQADCSPGLIVRSAAGKAIVC